MKIILYTAISLDNFIARENGDTSWLNSSEYKLKDEDFGYKKFYDSIGYTLMGNSTYKVVKWL